MSNSPSEPTDRYRLANLLSSRGLATSAAIGALLAAIVGGFAFVGGYLSPDRLTPAKVVDQFERTNGVHPGFRRNHPKGLCFSGWFDSVGHGQALSKARVFAPDRTPVFGRFAIANGQPALPDLPNAVFSMAVNFALQDGEIWRTGMNGIPVFPAQKVSDLTDQLAAAAPDPATGKPDPARLTAFLASHPAAARAIAIIKAKPLAEGFANTSYNSLNAFLFVDAAGRSTPVRWTMVAEDPFVAAGSRKAPDAGQAHDPDYHFTDLAARLRRGPMRWHLVATVAGTGDPIGDPSLPWPADRRRVDLGVLTIDALADEAHGACRDVTFDPLILPNGIRPSHDPILSARSAAYARSFTRRAGEPAPASPVPLVAGNEGSR